MTISEGALRILRELEDKTGLSPSQLIQKIALAHAESLSEYLRWLNSIPESESSLRSDLGKLILRIPQQSAPAWIQASIKRIDPTYDPTIQ